jgi:simple sugar transport system substrate-binding protein
MKKLVAVVAAVLLVCVFAVSCTGTQQTAQDEAGKTAQAQESAASAAPAQTEGAQAQESQGEASGAIAPEDMEIPVVVKIEGIPFFNVLGEGVKKAADELGVNAYTVGPTDADPAQQVKLVEDLINTGVKSITVVPNDATALEAVFKRAQEKGITVIANESPGQPGADWDIEMIDNEKFGIACAEAAASAAGGEGGYVMFVGGLSVPLHNTWADVARDYLAEKYPNMKEVTDRIPCGEDADLARTKTLELMKSYPELKTIIGFGSLGPIGAAQAVREKGLNDDFTVVGTVIPSQASEYLKDGSVDKGFLWDPSDSGYACVYTAYHILSGGTIDENFEIPGIGKPSIQNGNVLAFDATLEITAENADSLGF